MHRMPPMNRDEQATQRPGDIAGSDRVALSGATTTWRTVDGPLSVSRYGADVLDIFRCARPEA